MGFNAPSKIQETALPTLLADPPQNMIAQSQSGTGKTAAFVLAMLSRVNTSLQHPQVLCLSPTFELALQIGEVASKMSQFCPDLSIRFHKNLSPECQMLLFSATYDQNVMDFAENIVSNPVTIKLRREEESVGNIVSNP